MKTHKTHQSHKPRRFRLLRLLQLEKKLLFLLALVLFVVLNVAVSFVGLRLDLSNGKAYTLSPATGRILKDLDDIVTISFYVSSDLPTRLLPLKTQAADLLREYKQAGGRKVTLKTLDPKKDQNASNEAKEAGVPELQFSEMQQDKFAVTASQFGIVLKYGGKTDVLPQVTDIASLEYNLTAAIYKMSRKTVPKVGIIDPAATTDPQSERFGALKQVLGQQFQTAMAKTDGSPDMSYNALVVADSPIKDQGTTIEKYLRSYLGKGGRAVVFTDGVNVDDNNNATPMDSGMKPLLNDYGIDVHQDLVLSTSSELVTFGNQSTQFVIPYPFWVKTNNFNKNASMFSNINQLTYPWVSSVAITKKNGISTEAVVKSTPQSWTQKSTFTLNPQEIPEPKQNELSTFTVATLSKGKGNAQLLVIPSLRFVQDKYLSQQSGNLGFILNVLNDMASGGALTGIRQRAVFFYPLPQMDETEKQLVRYGSILLLPVLFAVYGGWRLMKRK